MTSGSFSPFSAAVEVEEKTLEERREGDGGTAWDSRRSLLREWFEAERTRDTEGGLEGGREGGLEGGLDGGRERLEEESAGEGGMERLEVEGGREVSSAAGGGGLANEDEETGGGEGEGATKEEEGACGG